MLSQALGIRSTPAAVNIRSTPARVEIHSQPGELSIEGGMAEMELQTAPGQLSIDSTAGRQEMGYYHPLALLAELVGYTQRQVQRAIAEMVGAGESLSQNYNGADMLAELAYERMFVDYNDREFVVTMIPRTPPSVRYTPGSLNMSFRARLARVQFTARPPMISVRAGERSIDVTPASLRMYVRQPGVLDLSV